MFFRLCMRGMPVYDLVVDNYGYRHIPDVDFVVNLSVVVVSTSR